MKRVRRDYSRQTEYLRTYLAERGWKEVKRSKSIQFFVAPPELGLGNSFTLGLPLDPLQSGTDLLLTEIVNALREIYHESFSSLDAELAANAGLEVPAMIGIRFIDESTADGGIALSALAQFLPQARRGLYETAKFRLDGSAHGPANNAAALFAESCRFLQTAVGSFVVRIEIPFQQLTEPDLFSTETQSTNDIVAALHTAMDFLATEVIGGEKQLEYVAQLPQTIGLFDPELLSTYTKLLVDTEVRQIDIETRIGRQRRVVSTGVLEPACVERLKAFSRLVTESFYGEDDFQFRGSVLELRSRDPEGDKNHVVIVGDLFGDRTYVSAKLSNEQYRVAVAAHQGKRLVRLRGMGVRLKTQVRMRQVLEFSIV